MKFHIEEQKQSYLRHVYIRQRYHLLANLELNRGHIVLCKESINLFFGNKERVMIFFSLTLTEHPLHSSDYRNLFEKAIIVSCMRNEEAKCLFFKMFQNTIRNNNDKYLYFLIHNLDDDDIESLSNNVLVMKTLTILRGEKLQKCTLALLGIKNVDNRMNIRPICKILGQMLLKLAIQTANIDLIKLLLDLGIEIKDKQYALPDLIFAIAQGTSRNSDIYLEDWCSLALILADLHSCNVNIETLLITIRVASIPNSVLYDCRGKKFQNCELVHQRYCKNHTIAADDYPTLLKHYSNFGINVDFNVFHVVKILYSYTKDVVTQSVITKSTRYEKQKENTAIIECMLYDMEALSLAHSPIDGEETCLGAPILCTML